jgi:hypothetical protein
LQLEQVTPVQTALIDVGCPELQNDDVEDPDLAWPGRSWRGEVTGPGLSIVFVVLVMPPLRSSALFAVPSYGSRRRTVNP